MDSRPHVFVNAAMTADGKTDSVARRGAQISSAEDWERVDRLRAGSDAVMVGGKTLLGEDPRLSVKSPGLRAERVRQGKPESPIKVGVVSSADIPENSRFLHEGNAQVIIFTTRRTRQDQAAQLARAGAEVHLLGEERVDLPAALRLLHERGVRRLMVEGGGTLISELFRQGLVDELYLYIAPLIFAGASAPTLADGPGLEAGSPARLSLHDISAEPDGGVLIHYLVINATGG
jgi:2,5-diamino-6-(ribosylamino)-4(3H)-pyrimidinone 5'-phosphate reductase